MAGVMLTGFETKTVSQCVAEMEARARGEYGAGVDLDARQPLGQAIGIFAEREAAVWDALQDVYRSADPDGNEGDAQDAICAITGTLRDPAEKSTVKLVLAGTAGSPVGKDSVASITGTGVRWLTKALATIVAGTAWVGGTAYATVGTRRTNSGSVYEVITGGTAAASGGPTGTGNDIVDGTVHWKWIITGTAFVEVEAEAEQTGPIPGPAGTITVIETPVSGWDGVRNPLDAELGANVESHAHLRTKREEELRAAGAAALEAIRADVLEVEGVTACTVFENDTGTTNADGVPAKAFEVLVSGGADQDILNAIWKTKAGGIYPHGTVVGTAVDSQGVSHTVRFTRATDRNIYAAITLTKDTSKYPADGDNQVKAAVVAAGAKLASGDDVVARALLPAVFSISGVTDVPHIYIGFAAGPTSEANLAIGSREIAKFDTSRITVA